ncbi:MAG: exosome complex protein Rrp42 [Candidatus Pacearchaeota archaeon]|nr:exosome complex protein Rrp42 [Candidatus Pacearchaeota archaeon]
MEISNLTKQRILDYLNEGKRFDSRNLEDFRKIEIEIGVSKNAEGSARVKFGNTEVIAGVKIATAEPYTDHEGEGTLMTTCELLPLSSPRFESGPPSIEAIEIARIVDRGVRESGFIDFGKLCIKEGEKVYSIMLDIYPLNEDGNMIDAAALACVVALKNAKMPKYDEKTGKIEFGKLTNKPIPLTDKTPLTITFHKIGKKIIVDPTREEEDTSEARVSMALFGKKEVMITAMQKGGEADLTEEELEKMLDLGVEKFKELSKLVYKAVGE